MFRPLVKAMVIGDGYLSLEKGCRNARFGCLHSIKQKPYLLWKQKLLARAGLTTSYKEREDHGSALVAPTQGRCEMRSRVHPALTAIYQRMYPKENGFSAGILDDLGEMHLAIIFMDDGGKNAAAHSVPSGWPGSSCVNHYDRFVISFTIHLQSWGIKGCHQFIDWLKRRFLVEARIGFQRGQPVVKVYKTEAKKRLRDVVEPHLVPTMKYKVEGRMHARPERLSEGAPTLA